MDSTLSPSLPSRPCPACGGTGFALTEFRGQSVARPCACRRRSSSAKEKLEAAHIPSHYLECEFSNFDTPGRHGPVLLGAKVMAERYATEYPLSRERGLMFMGPPGVGKTHLAVAILRYLILEKRVDAAFYDVQDLLRTLQGTFDRQSGMSELDLLQPVLEAEIVLLDDLGGRLCTPWVEETLNYIVTTRYNERRPTLVTTNYLDDPKKLASSDRVDEPKKTRDFPLSDRIGPRVRSRLHEMCHLVEVLTDDFRLLVAAADHSPMADRFDRQRDGA